MNINSIYESISTKHNNSVNQEELPPIIESDAHTYLENLTKKKYTYVSESPEAQAPIKPSVAKPANSSIDLLLDAVKHRYNSTLNEESKQVMVSVLSSLIKK